MTNPPESRYISFPQASRARGPAGSVFGFLRGRLARLDDLAQGVLERPVVVFLNAELARRFYELLLLCLACVRLAYCHGASRWLRSVGDLLACREVRHV